jgi:PAS domain S-box-containing protein
MAKKPTYEELEQRIRDFEATKAEQKKMEGVLRQSESRLKQAQYVARIGNWDMDIETGSGFWSDELFRLLGYQPNEKVPSYSLFREHVHHNDVENFDESFKKYTKNLKHVDEIFRFTTKNGDLRYAQSVGRIEFDEAGNALRAFGTFQDITERKQIEQNLIESEEKFRTVFENINDAVFIHKLLPSGEPGSFLYFNSAAIKMSGYSSEELNSMSPRELDDPDTSRRYIPIVMEELKKQKRSKFEAVQIAKDGRKIDVEVNAVVAKIGGQDLIVSVCRDITEKKAYRENLIKKEQFLYAIYKGISHSIFVVDVLENGNFQYAGLNPQHEKITGISNDFIVGKRPEDVLPKDVAQEVCKHYVDCVNLKQTKIYEEWLPFRGKQTCWETTLNPQISESGQVYQIIGTSQEITERKNAEIALRESEERFKLLVENSPISIMMVRKGKYIYGNPASAALLGFENPSQIVGVDALKPISTEFHAPLRKRMDQIKTGKSNEPMKIKTIKPNGETAWTLSTSISVKIDDRPTAVVFALDITDQRNAEQKMSALSSVVESSDDIIVVKNLGMRVLATNKAFAKASGHDSASEVIGKTDAEIFGVSPQKEPIRSYMADEKKAQTLPKGKYILREEPVFYPDGQSRTYLTKKYPIYDGELLIGTGNISRDITDLKKMEKQLNHAQKLESIGSLAGGIAHDFNNLLFPIVGLSEMMLETFPPGSPEHHDIQQIYKAGNRGRELVQQILSFSRQSEKHLIPVHIQKILKEVFKLCRATIPADISITRDIQTDCRPVMADPTQIHQIAMNLITNAYHSVEPTGGSISIQLKEITYSQNDTHADQLESGAYVMLSVSDTGTGIDPAIMDKIFDPYFTTKEKGRGTGMGLATVYGIVKAHGGDIRVYSEVGEGACFHVYLPVLEKTETIDTHKQSQTIPKGTEHILLVDDEPSIVHLEKQMLERLGYRITSFTGSKDALAAFETDPTQFDLVLTDMNMPHLNGMQLAKKLIAVRPDLPIILCTGFSERTNITKIEASGIRGLLMKPVGMTDLAHKVREVLGTMKE